jgi:hypothetical protein
LRQLHRTIYASRVTPELQLDLDGTLRRILQVAVRENARQDITGLLIAHRGWFVQALEGPTAAVREKFGLIVRDPRHRDVIILAEGPTEARLFGAWSMCAAALSATDAAVLEVLDQKASFDPADMPERTVIRLLTAVAAIHARSLNDQYADLRRPALDRAS